jgi:hypothetical protein
MRRTLAGVALATAGLLVAACGSPSSSGVSGKAIKPLAASAVPATLGDLEVHSEGVQNLIASTKDTYVTAVGLYSLRQDNLVKATLQVSRLTDKFDYRSDKQRALLADKIGGARSDPHRVGSDIVYLTQGLRQQISVWFRSRYLFVLSVREDYPGQRSLLRDALDVKV